MFDPVSIVGGLLKSVVEGVFKWKEGDRNVKDSELRAHVKRAEFAAVQAESETQGAIVRAGNVLEEEDETDFSPREHRSAFRMGMVGRARRR